MKERIRDLGQKMRHWWQEASPTRKLSLLVMAVLVLGTFSTMVILAARQDYRILLADAAPEEVQAVVAQLKKANIPCRVSGSGTTVQVVAERLDQARMEVASSGLTRGGTGFELFDRRDFGMTSFQERINYRRALEGELARTIRSLVEVRSARVHLVVPRRALFRQEHVDPSASVVVNLKPGRQLQKRQLSGIRQLVASAVEGLEPRRVTVLDGHGAILARAQENPDEQIANDRAEYQHQLERMLEARIISLLEPVVGLGKVVAQVNADVELQRVVETAESYDPDGTAIRSEQISQEVQGNPGDRAQGVPGSRSNLPGSGDNKPGTTPAVAQRLERNTKTVNYEVSKKVRQVEHGAISLKRISAAVVVDGTYQREGEGEQAKTVYQPRPTAEMTRLRELVKKAIGFDPARGDQVEVSNLAFRIPQEEVPVGWLADVDVNKIVQWLVILVAVVLLLLLVVRPLLGFGRAAATEIMLPGGRPATVLEIEQNLRQRHQAPLLNEPEGQGTETMAMPESPPEKLRVAALQEQARQLAEKHPERTVQLLRSWLHGESL